MNHEPTSPKGRKLLHALLNGRRMSVIDTIMEFNLMTPNARVSEMRKAGWPIKSLKEPHPRFAQREDNGLLYGRSIPQVVG